MHGVLKDIPGPAPFFADNYRVGRQVRDGYVFLHGERMLGRPDKNEGVVLDEFFNDVGRINTFLNQPKSYTIIKAHVVNHASIIHDDDNLNIRHGFAVGGHDRRHQISFRGLAGSNLEEII